MHIDGKALEDYRFFQELKAFPFVEAIYLTGSRARGDHHERSDIDLAICCPLATDEEWNKAFRTARYNDEILMRVDAIRLDKVTDPEHRNILLYKRQLLYLKTYGSTTIVRDNLDEFFRIWHEKLTGWVNYMPSFVGIPDEAKAKQILESFHACMDCVWVMVRKCIAIHGMHTNTPLTTFREAYMEGWLDNRLLWERMLEDYHTSKLPQPPDILLPIYQRMPTYIAEIKKTADKMLTIIKPYIHAHVIT